MVCLLLLALLAVVQVAHVHPLGSEADHCQLCVVMHSAAPAAAAVAIAAPVTVGTPIPNVEALPKIHHFHPKLFTRPPPTGC